MIHRALFGSSLTSLILTGALFTTGGCSDGGGGGTTGNTTTSSSTTGAGGSGGSGGSGGAGGSAPLQVALAFEGRVGAKAFKCTDTHPGLGASAMEVSITDFRFYVHDVKLHQKGGGDVAVELDQDGLWQYQNVALLDFEDKSGSCANGTTETNGAVRGTVPAGEYDGVSFKLGVPFALNHADVAAAPSPLNLSALFWNWNGGYKFLRVDSVPTAGGGPFNLHLGSTGCTGEGKVDLCSNPNVAEISFSAFDHGKDIVLADYATVVAGSDLGVNGGGAPGCMSGVDDPECQALFERLGIDLATGSPSAEKQAFFRVK